MDPATPSQALEDELAASQSDAPLLLTADTRHEIERLARRIHRAGPRAKGPFVPVRVQGWSTTSRAIKKRWSAVFGAAVGGTVLLSDIEEMSPTFQNVFLEVVDAVQHPRPAAAAARLISGTTVSLVDRVASGAFSERLFRRLNVIHLVMRDGVLGTAKPTAGHPSVPTAQSR